LAGKYLQEILAENFGMCSWQMRIKEHKYADKEVDRQEDR